MYGIANLHHFPETCKYLAVFISTEVKGSANREQNIKLTLFIHNIISELLILALCMSSTIWAVVR